MRGFCLDCGSEVCVYDDPGIRVPERPAEPPLLAELREEVKRLAGDVRNLLRANGELAVLWAEDQERIAALSGALNRIDVKLDVARLGLDRYGPQHAKIDHGLPLRSATAVLVRPVPCPVCKGRGTVGLHCASCTCEAGG